MRTAIEGLSRYIATLEVSRHRFFIGRRRWRAIPALQTLFRAGASLTPGEAAKRFKGADIDGQPFTALNGRPVFQFNEAISMQVFCATQDESDYYWGKLSAGGDPNGLCYTRTASAILGT